MKTRTLSWWLLLLGGLICLGFRPGTHAILAGHENWLPADMPSQRIDYAGADSPFNFVGALSITSGGRSYIGSASALSPEWVLTAGHNLDTNDDGSADAGVTATFHLPGFGEFSGAAYHVHPGFTGFSNGIHHDVALIRLADPLPAGINFPGYSFDVAVGDVVTLAGFGRSGFGSYGYTTAASLTNRRIGANTIETVAVGEGGEAEIFRYTFHHPETAGSLGNDIETIIGPGDSGGPVLVEMGEGYGFVGVSTFTEGFGGRFGDIGGGVVLEPYYDWIHEMTGVAIPEPGAAVLVAGVFGWVLVLIGRRCRRG